MIILGIDPSLSCTGWGIVAKSGNRLTHIANGQVKTDAKASLPERLVTLDRELTDVILAHRPDAAAVEEVFVNKNPQSTLKLGQARGVCLLAAARAGLPVSEYATRLVKKAIVGTGGAEKAQVQAMLGVLLPGVKLAGEDAADALAVAIAHAHLMGSPSSRT
ncbi:crossover junction endodeoxyribonuclease RuvC [Novosphingobium sp. MW5]|nr:crossover junction endodeoxyribonuclease RuvC [Novosphingobium sp. MW5]